jgi:maltooligosyltrehalose trehalohydrolase
MLGERSSALIGFEALKLSAGMVLLAPNLPLLFMGEEYSEDAPFLYFTDHADPQLQKAVREGRQAEFAGFYSGRNAPDPQAESTFLRSKLDPRLREREAHLVLWNLYRELIRLRKSLPPLRKLDECSCEVSESDATDCFTMLRVYGENAVAAIFNFGEQRTEYKPGMRGDWHLRLNSAETRWNGPGNTLPQEYLTTHSAPLLLEPKSLCLFERIT